MLGVAAVLAVLARDRNQRIDQAHARLEALHRERSRLQIAVYRIGDAFASKLDLDALLTITTRAAVEALDADGGRGSAHQGPGRKLVRRATVHEDVDLEPALRAAEDTAVALGSATVAMVDGVWALACPIAEPSNAEAHGMIVLARRASAFADEERDLLRHLCEQAGVAAGNSQRHETLHRQALTDELTGLANHRRMQELLAQGAERWSTAGTSLALILFDLDNFKKVNDTRGHQTGDHVLRAVSDTLRDCCRTGDEPARYGGEELAIVVQGASFDEVLALAERARAAVAALELIDMEGKDLRVSTSIGVAELGPQVPGRRDAHRRVRRRALPGQARRQELRAVRPGLGRTLPAARMSVRRRACCAVIAAGAVLPLAAPIGQAARAIEGEGRRRRAPWRELLGHTAVALFVQVLNGFVQTFRLGQPESRTDHPATRWVTLVREFLGHTRMSRLPVVTVAHWFVMVSFGVLFFTLVNGVRAAGRRRIRAAADRALAAARVGDRASSPGWLIGIVALIVDPPLRRPRRSAGRRRARGSSGRRSGRRTTSRRPCSGSCCASCCCAGWSTRWRCRGAPARTRWCTSR